jgi:hypothetical protein
LEVWLLDEAMISPSSGMLMFHLIRGTSFCFCDADLRGFDLGTSDLHLDLLEM